MNQDVLEFIQEKRLALYGVSLFRKEIWQHLGQ